MISKGIWYNFWVTYTRKTTPTLKLKLKFLKPMFCPSLKYFIVSSGVQIFFSNDFFPMRWRNLEDMCLMSVKPNVVFYWFKISPDLVFLSKRSEN
jgi:hypothetical protein